MTENNKLFAEFLGYNYYPHSDTEVIPGWRKERYNPSHKLSVMKGDYLCRTHKQLRFDTDWNWLMKVVEKIESLNYDFEILGGEWVIIIDCDPDRNESDVIIETSDETKLSTVYKACLQFINWYNDNRNKI